MLVILMVAVFAGTASCLDAEVIDTITFPDANCDGTRCHMELAAGGQLYSLHLEDTVDIAPPYLLIEEVYSNRTVSHRVQNPQGCVHYGKVVRNKVAVGSMVLSLCDTKTATLYTDDGEYSVVPIRQEDRFSIRRRRSADTHVVYRDSAVAKSRVKRNASPVLINHVVAPPRFTETQLPSYKRLSPGRTLRVEVALFIDKEFQDAYSNSPFGKKEPKNLMKHIMNIMKQVQMWYFLPSLGYKMHIYITKIVLMKETVAEIDEYEDMTSFCETYQFSFLPGGSRAKKSNVTWDDAIYFSGVVGMFGKRGPDEYIYGRAHRWGACNPKYQCMGINDHFEVSPDLWRIERYLGRLVSHELAHTFGMSDEYSDWDYKNVCKEGLMVSQYTGRWWSNCSVYELEKFLISEFSNCLDTVPEKNKDTIQASPATPYMYNSTGNAIDGGWSPWGDFGPCSKTCDGGVRLALRECNNPEPQNFGRICIGFRYKMELCNEQPCHDDIQNKSIWDLYTEECVKTGSRETFKLDTPGLYKLKGTPACAHRCNEKGTTMWWDYKVTNGFKCRDGQDDVCVDGLCMNVGCDDDFYSDKRRDRCGVCGGNGKSCRIVRGVFRGQAIGRTIAKILPKGSRNIYITINATMQNDMRNNFIDLGEEDIDVNPYSLIPTKWNRLREGREGTYKVWWAGVLWEYFEDRWLPHFLRTKYRLKDEAIVWLRREKGAAPNRGIMWQYTIDVHTPEPCGSDSTESWEDSEESWEKTDESWESDESWEKSGESWEKSFGCSEEMTWESLESDSWERGDSRSGGKGRGGSHRKGKHGKGRKSRGRGGRKT